jgi:hypothetical protein
MIIINNNNNGIVTNQSNYLEMRNVKYKYLQRIIVIQINSILVYIRANSSAQRPITKLARVRRKTK